MVLCLWSWGQDYEGGPVVIRALRITAYHIVSFISCNLLCQLLRRHSRIVALLIVCGYDSNPRLQKTRPSSDEKLFPVQDGNSGASVTSRSLFKRPLSGTTFLPISDTAVPSYSSKLLSKPFSSILPSLSHLDPLEDFCHGLLTSALLICQ